MWGDNYSSWHKALWKKRMIQTIIINSKLREHPTLNSPIMIDTLNTPQTIQQINKLLDGPLHIYDITYNTKHKTNETIKILDHINKTGHNPLIGNQQITQNNFIDISGLYNSPKGITTHCLGNYFNLEKNKYDYPSKYLCHISIVAKAAGINTVKGLLINQRNEKT